MEIKYDSEVDAVYIELRKGDFDHNKKVDKNTILNYDKEGNILGIELLDVKENNPNILENISIKNIIATA